MISTMTKAQEKKVEPDVATAIRFFESHGCKVLKPKSKNSSGPDLNIIKDEACYRVEIKKLRKQKNMWICDSVEEKRRNDDFIIVVTNDKVISFDSMEKHLKLCNNSGQRYFYNEMLILKN